MRKIFVLDSIIASATAILIGQWVILPALCILPNRMKAPITWIGPKYSQRLSETYKTNFTAEAVHLSPNANTNLEGSQKSLEKDDMNKGQTDYGGLENIQFKRSLRNADTGRTGRSLISRINRINKPRSEKITLPLDDHWLDKLRQQLDRPALRNLLDSRFLCCVVPGKKSKGSVDCYLKEFLNTSYFKCSSGLVYNIRFGSNEQR